MSAHAVRTSEVESPGLARFLDLIVLAATFPIFLVTGLPLMGWVGGAGVWLLQRAVREFLESRALKATDPRAVVGLTAGSMVARGWIAALCLMGLYALTDADTALAAAVLFLMVFTFFFTANMAMRPVQRYEAMQPEPDREGER